MAAETRTLLFSYAVRGGFNGDLDTDGMSWNANVIGLNGLRDPLMFFIRVTAHPVFASV